MSLTKNLAETAKAAATKPEVAKIQPVPVQTPKEEADKLPPLDERLHRLNQLFNLQEKYNRLQTSLIKLNEFEIKKDGERSRLSLADDSRNEFSTYNPEIITEVVDFLKKRIKEKTKSIEPLLKW